MGTRTLSDFRDDVNVKLGNRTDAAATDARLNRWINDAYFKMANSSVKRFRELRQEHVITLVQNQDIYDIDVATLGRQDLGTYSVSYFDTTGDITVIGVTKHQLNPRSQRVKDRRSDYNARPRFYSTESGETNELVVWPTPGASEAGRQLQYKYWAQPLALALDTDTTILPDEYDAALSYGAIAVTMSHLPGMDDESLMAMRLFQQWVNGGADPTEKSADDWGHRAEVRVREYMNQPTT